MKFLNKKIIAVIAIIAVLTAGFMITACSKKKQDTPVTPTEWTVTMDSTLSMTEGETKVLSFTSNQEGDLNVSWKSSDRNVVDFIKGSDGFATLTAKNVGTATMMLTVMKGTDSANKQTLVCTVTVSEYKNDALRIVYSVDDSNASQYAIETNIKEEGFKYNEEVSVKITPNKGYAFLSLSVGEEGSSTNYLAEKFTKNTDGSYTLTFKANLKPTGNETTINVPVTVNMAQIIFDTQIDSAVTIGGLSEDGYSVGQTLSLTATWVNAEDANTKICAVYYNSKEIFADNDGKYTFEVDSVINSLVVKTGIIESKMEETVTVAANTSFIKTFPSVSTKGVLLATFSYDQAKTASKYKFGIRLYNESAFCTRLDIIRVDDAFALTDSKTSSTYTFVNGENVQDRLLNGTFGIGIERNGKTYNIWVTDGNEIVQAFTDLVIESSNSWWQSIGTTPGDSTPVGSVIGLKYLYYDGQQGVENYMHPVVNETATNATVSGIKNEDKLDLWNTTTFTVTAEGNYKVSKVTLNDAILTATSVEESVYTYTVVVTDPSKFDLTVITVDPTAAATFTFNNEKNLKVEIIEGEKESYCASEEIKIKVTSTDRLIIFEGITQNGLPVSAQNGVYTITLEEGENVIAILAHSAIVTGTSSGEQLPATETTEQVNTLVDVRSNIEQSISSPSPFSTLATVLKFEEATAQTAEQWRVDLRFYSTDSNSDFFPMSIGKDKKGLCISKRFSSCLYFKDLGEGNYSEDGVLQALADGKFRLAIVKTAGKTYTVYCDNGLGDLVLLGSMKNEGAINDSQYFYKIAFGGTSSGVVNNTLHCSIAWTWYDSITDADFVLPIHYDLTVKAKAVYNDEQVTVSGLNSEGYKVGDTVSFTVAAKTGFAISKVTVNGKEYTPGSDGKVEFTFESYALNIVVESIFATIVPTVNKAGEGTVSGLNESYKVGDSASFTVTAEDSVVFVTLNGATLTAENGTYSFIVGEKIELDIKIVKNSKATVEIDADTAFTLSEVNTTVNYYDISTALTFTVTLKDYSGYDKSTIVVKHNGADVTATEGSYQITLTGGVNTISVTATKYTKLEKTVSGNHNDLETGFATSAANQTGVYVLKLAYTSVDMLMNNDICMLDIRTYTTSNKQGFYAVGSLHWSETGGFSFTTGRNVDSMTNFGTENTESIAAKLKAGTYTVVIVNDATKENNITVYADNGTGTLVKIGETNKTFNACLLGFAQWNSGVYAFEAKDKDKMFVGTACGYSAYYYAATTDFTVCPELAGFTVSAE